VNLGSLIVYVPAELEHGQMTGSLAVILLVGVNVRDDRGMILRINRDGTMNVYTFPVTTFNNWVHERSEERYRVINP
jgi:hypothetical protein